MNRTFCTAASSRVTAHRRFVVLAVVVTLTISSAIWGLLVSPALAETAARLKSRAAKLQYGCRNKLTGVVRPLSSGTIQRFSRSRGSHR